MFPIFDSRGRVTGFGARVLDSSLPKYVNSPQTPVFDKSGTLYGINLAAVAIRQQDLVVIVEGYMDVITAHQNGLSNVVASMGTSITEKQVSALKKLTRNVALALDADTAGEEAMLRSVSYENALGAEVKAIILPKGKDPDEVIKENAGNWQKILDGALPVVDYTFNMAASELDLTTARDKSLAVDRLLPIVAEIKNPVRQSHYFQKLARLVRVNERSLEVALKRIKSSQVRRRGNVPAPASRIVQPLLSSPVEEYCLTLLLQHPELKNNYQGLAPENFGNTENREIFTAWQQVKDLASLAGTLDPTLHEHLEYLRTRTIPTTGIEKKYTDCVLRLREKYLRSLETKRAEVLTLAAEGGNELVRLEEQGVEISEQLGEVFAQERQTRSGRKEVAR